MPIQLVVASVSLVLLIMLFLARLILWWRISRNPDAYWLNIEESIAIARRTEEVFDFLADIRNDMVLSHRVVAVEITTPGPIRVGTTYRQIVRLGPAIQTTIECTITDYISPQHIGTSCQYAGRTLRGGYRVAPQSAGCVVTTISETQHTTASLLFAPLTKLLIRRECRGTLHHLRAALESPR